MKRSAALTPLSRDHHKALAVALRLRRADGSSLDAAVAAFRSFWAGHGQRHFEIEEQVLVPLLPDDREWQDGVRRMVGEHDRVRAAARALLDAPAADACRALGSLLDAHVRFEERELFVLLEQRLDPAALAAAGAQIDALEAGEGSTRRPSHR